MEAVQDVPLTEPPNETLQRIIIGQFWGNPSEQNSNPSSIRGIDSTAYFKYYNRMCSLYTKVKPLSNKSHREILDIVNHLKNDMTRPNLRKLICASNILPDLETADILIDLAVDLLTMSASRFVPSKHSKHYAKLQWEHGPLRDYLLEFFTVTPNLSNKSVRMRKKFNARMFVAYTGIRIIFTSNLADHLRLTTDDRSLTIFHYASFLKLQQLSLLPSELVKETLRTLGLLFPQDEDDIRWIACSGFTLDPELAYCGNVDYKDRRLRNFRYWHDRLVILKQAFDSHQHYGISPWQLSRNPDLKVSLEAKNDDSLYKPLRYGNHEIRLVTFLPSSNPEVQLCSLNIVPLPKAPSYTALSYCWDHAIPTTNLVANNRVVTISHNLHLALLQLNNQGVEHVWVDALCIDQTNDEEKSIQVSRMGTIFRKAAEVVVWLGNEEPDNLDILFQEQDLSKISKDARTSALRCFQDLLERSFWDRVWVIQEVAVASRISVWCGRYSVTWDRFNELFEVLSDNSHRVTLVNQSSSGFSTLLRFRQESISRRPIHFLDALHRSNMSLSTDPRDKLYALLGLTFDGRHFIPEPNYMSETTQIFTEFTTALIAGGEPLDFIYLRSAKRKVSFFNNLPSWVPDWANLGDIVAKRQLDFIMPWCSSWSKSTDSKVDFNNDEVKCSGSELTVRGVIIDTITALGSSFASSTESDRLYNNEIKASDEPETDQNDIERSDLVLDLLTNNELIPSTMRNIPKYYSANDQNGSSSSLTDAPPILSEAILKWLSENQYFEIYGRTIQSWSKSLNLIDEAGAAIASPFFNSIQSRMKLMTTKRGYIGWAHPRAEIGDQVARLVGCRRFVILRASEQRFQIVGDAILGSQVDDAQYGSEYEMLTIY